MPTATVPEVTDATFAPEVERAAGVVMVEFTAAWCGPCRVLAPTVAALAAEYAGRARVVTIDADANAGTTVRFAVRGLPTTLLFRDGVLVDRITGAVPAPALRARLDAALAG